LAQTFDPRAQVSGNTQASGDGPGTAVPTPYPILTTDSIFLPANDASCHPAKRASRKPGKAVSPGHRPYLRASRAVGEPWDTPIHTAESLLPLQKRPGTVRGRTLITARSHARHSEYSLYLVTP